MISLAPSGSASRRLGSDWAWALGISALGLATFGLTVFTEGNPIAAAVPVVAVTLAWLMWRLPLRFTVPALLFLALVADAPQDNPADGMWVSPLYWLGMVLCNNWSKSFHLPGGSFSGIEVALAVLCTKAFFERRERAATGLPAASALSWASAIFLGALALLTVWGLGRGGQGNPAYWQVRQLMLVPLFAYACSCAVRSLEDAWRLGTVAVWAGVIKLATGFFFFFAIATPRGLGPAFITSHSDTLLFVACIAIAFARWVLEPSWSRLRSSTLMTGYFLFGIYLNNRRLAYGGLIFTVLLVLAYTERTRAKQWVARILVALLPFMAVYVGVGWNSTSRAFQPVASLRSMFDAKADASTRSREVENYNLSQTLRAHALLGTGLGRPYDEVVHGDDISQAFELWNYIPHNSVLWLLSAGGLLFFVPLWSLFITGAYLAARANRHAKTRHERVMALVCLCVVALFVTQLYGDMGGQNWVTTWCLGAALAVAGKLATGSGAWPVPVERPAVEEPITRAVAA